MWINKYKRNNWRYWYDTPQRYAKLEIKKIQKCNRNYRSYCNVFNICLMGVILKMYSFIYSGHKKEAFNIYRNIDYEFKYNFPKWLIRYFE